MNDIKDTLNIEDADMKKLPDMLNVLTILTYIGSAFGLLGLISNLFQDCDTVLNQLDDLPEMDGMLGSIMDMSRETMVVFCENKTLMLITALAGVVLCVVGAIQMRNLKKQGFVLYTIGELLPPLVGLILGLGAAIWLSLIGFIVPIIFIALYASQRKFLVK